MRLSGEQRTLRLSAILFAAIAALAAPASAMAEPALDRLLASVSIEPAGQCAVIDIALNRPLTTAGHFPSESGTELTIRAEQLGTEQTPDKTTAPAAEAASVAPDNAAGLVSLSFDAAKANPELHLTFDHQVRFKVGRGTDSRHVIVTTSATTGDPANCGTTGGKQDKGSADTTYGSTVEAALADGKKSLAKKDYSAAVGLLTKAVSRSTGAVKRDAQEYLGLARERAGQLAHAKAEYQTYLKDYPAGEGADRVRQRLAGVIAASEAEAGKEFAARKSNLEKPQTAPKLDFGEVALRKTLDPKGDLAGAKGDLPGDKAGEWTWSTHGSAGQFYYRDDGFSDLRLLRGTYDTHSVNQNELVSSGDVTIRGENERSAIEVRVSGYQENGLDDINNSNSTNVSTAYVDMRGKDNGLSLRAGRQSRSGGGVFGRFDGALAGMKIDKNFELKAVAGSPVYYKSTEPFADGRYFYGASLDMTTSNEVLSATIYAIQQTVEDIVDRRAIGGELRYAKDDVTAYGALDYDVYYNEINSAYVSGSWLATKDVTLYGTADYRHVPFLLTSNALIGQSATSLSDLIDIFGHDTTEQLAVDRTASAETLTLGASYKLSQDWQIALDATIANYTGTPASGGVDEIPDPGMEYYLSGQLSGANVFTENDYLGLGLRFLDSSSYTSYIADMSLRYPVNDDLRLNPRLRLAYREAKSSDVTQILIMPSLGARYRFTDHWSLEVEGGARFEDITSSAGNSQNAEFLLTAGYRYEF